MKADAPLKISAIVCAYNESRLLPGCLYSLRSQTRPPDEILVINNASTDETGAVARAVPGVDDHGANQHHNQGHRAGDGGFSPWSDDRHDDVRSPRPEIDELVGALQLLDDLFSFFHGGGWAITEGLTSVNDRPPWPGTTRAGPSGLPSTGFTGSTGRNT